VGYVLVGTMKNVAEKISGATQNLSPFLANGRQREDSPAFGAGFTPTPKQGESLPCLYSINSIREDQDRLHKLAPYHRKQAETLFQNTNSFVLRYGLENVGFLTLTFADNVKDHKEAGRRFNSLSTNFLNEHFGAWLLVKERQKRGAWHYHLLVDCGTDIRTGVDFGQFAKMDYSSAGSSLRSLWRVLRRDLRKYGFGRSELLPIRSNAEGVARYVGKYISKHVGARREEDKRVRLFSASRGFQGSNTNFSWNTVGFWIWRVKVREFAKLNGIGSYPGLQMKLGERWAFRNFELIYAQPVPKNVIFPTVAHWQAVFGASEDEWPLGYVEGMTNFRVVDHHARSALYDKDWEYSSFDYVPRRVLTRGFPQEQAALEWEEKSQTEPKKERGIFPAHNPPY